MTRRLRLLRRDRRGATVIEFAIVAPVLLLALMGFFDLLYRMYVQSALNGAMEKAGRASTMQGAPTRAGGIDAEVAARINDIAPQARTVFTRTAYRTFLDARPEEFRDRDGDGQRDPGECYDDRNGNRGYDLDSGRQGSGGGADDVVKYDAVTTYPRIFPMPSMSGWSATQVLRANTVLKNQPFAQQPAAAAIVEICTP